MLNQQQQFGKQSEALAVRHLKRNGYKIIDRNYSSQFGEIDIIAKEKATIVFVEVKARNSSQYGSAKWAVTRFKQRKISLTALYYLKETKQTNTKARFDVVTIDTYKSCHSIEIIKNAFELAYT